MFHFVIQQTNHKVLNDLSFIIEPGKWVRLIGYSGCGKSIII